MSHFDQLHSALRHHIVNSLGWRELRPIQEAVIQPILEGRHLIVLAPTAGGKTEAAFFPVVSRMLTEGWSGLSVLYVCPIKALLNHLDARLQRYTSLVGRRSALWHGDVTSSARRQVLRDPHDCLLTTPESLESMLVSPNVDDRRLFGNVRVVIVDEVHAFAGDDRGWHLLAVLERITRLAGREIQRIGLSATVGNPASLLDWLAGSCSGNRGICAPAEPAPSQAEVKLDYVGSLSNAAQVISRLHRGEKRLVFVDSRARAEQLGQELRGLDVTAFVTHSSLSHAQRREAEDAFANRDDCVIVATSVLELGIDVGSLDRVIQIDSPTTVASFLQRMGRTGRRTGTVRNCLFLATRDEALMQAAGLIDLWSEGQIEPIVPPVEPYHVLAQQLMALSLQESGIGRQDWLNWVGGAPAFKAMSPERIAEVVQCMVDRDVLWDDAGILGIGRQGEATYGRKHFMEVLSVFLSPPLFSVLHGRNELGFVDELTFLGKQSGQRVLLLGGRSWRVNHVDWRRKVAYVEPTEAPGRSRWFGAGQTLGFMLCQAIQRLLASDAVRPYWSGRAHAQLSELRSEFNWVAADSSAVVVNKQGEPQWWTFAGFRVNASLSSAMSRATRSSVASDSFTLTFETSLRLGDVESGIEAIRTIDVADLSPSIDDQAMSGLKFSDCLPPEIARRVIQMRMRDLQGIRSTLNRPVRFVAG